MTDQPVLTDRFGRKIDYLRLSVTDRCDFRCAYCMAEDMTFLPRHQVLTLEELTAVAQAFRNLGVTKLRVTGGEPLIRKDVLHLFRELGQMGFADLSLTTNGSHLEQYAHDLVNAGVDRVNISLDSLRRDRFKAMTRHGDLKQVLKGLHTANKAGFRRIKLNCVLMKHYNLDEATKLVQFALDHGMDISFIEEMPLGNVTSHSRAIEFVSSEQARSLIGETFKLHTINVNSGGPSKYWQVDGYETRVGFISPHSENFCGSCNRVRVSAEGRLLLCLGNEHSVDLKPILRETQPCDTSGYLEQTIVDAMAIKPERHHFNLDEQPQILRFMNATGG